MNIIKQKVQSINHLIVMHEGNIKTAQVHLEKLQKRKQDLQAQCNHDFEDNSHMVVDKTCKVCGYWEIGL